MDVQAIRVLVRAAGLGDLVACRRELADLASVRAMLARREMEVLRRLRHLGADGEGEHAQASKGTSRASSKARRRSDAGEQIPQLDDALAEGETTAEHVDVVADALAGMSPEDRVRLAGHGDEIRARAGELTESEFRRWLAMLVRRVRRDDAVARLARQKQACRAKWWLDHEGMWNLLGRFDPETGAWLQGRLGATTERLRQGPLPEGAPTDPLERHQWLQAHALAALIHGRHAAAATAATSGQRSDEPAEYSSSGSRDDWSDRSADVPSGPEMLVVIDAVTLLAGEHAQSIIDTLGFDLPLDTIRRWACQATVTPVVVGLDGTRLLLGRTTRLANADQRRALRVLYRTCGCCDTPFERCQIHHVQSWNNGGATDITSLLPLCGRCHHLAHEGGWQLELHPDRSLTITQPNGEQRTLDPPRAWSPAA